MGEKKYFLGLVAMVIVASLALSGCAVNFYKHDPRAKKKISELKSKISDLEKERQQFEEAKRMLEKKLQEQIAGKQISLAMDERGLVIILSDDILFDSGKAELKSDARPTLDKVIEVIMDKVPNKNIGISGHTDNVPITYSDWQSNWELSTARATTVLHYLEKQGIPSARLSATGYGEHRPIASNETAEGRAKNRRVEIVILPEFTEQRETAAEMSASSSGYIK